MISVIVPVYKVEPYLRKCVDSILAQTYKNIEIILVDDGSPDNCPIICDEYASNYKSVKVVHKENGGLTSAWKCGLENASSQCEYVMFVDSDDWIDPDCILDLMEPLESINCDIVVGNTIKFYKDDYKASPSKHSGYYNKARLEKEIYPFVINDGTFQGRSIQVSRCAKLFKKAILLDNVQYCSDGTTYAEDLNITVPAFLDAEHVFFLEEGKGKYFYQMNPESMLHAYDRKMLESINHIFPALRNMCRNKQHEEILPQITADFLAASVQYYKNELQNPIGLKQSQKNIAEYSKREDLQCAIEEINWRGYRTLNVIIIHSLRNFNWFNKNITMPLLMVLKKSGLKRPS